MPIITATQIMVCERFLPISIFFISVVVRDSYFVNTVLNEASVIFNFPRSFADKSPSGMIV